MSHASVLVALSPDDLQRAGGNVEEAVKHQMEPFDENGTWFREGSRWDWWSIGGRYSGRFAPVGYSPTADPANYEQCHLCNGTGMRNDPLGREARQRDPAYTCNGCGNSPWKGRALKFESHWVDIGNTIRRGDFSLEGYQAAARSRAELFWDVNAARFREMMPEHAKFIFGIEPGETRETYTARAAARMPCFYAFLRDRKWNEMERLGHFGMPAATECEVKAEASGTEFTGRCIHKNEEVGAQVVSWTGPGDTEERWEQLYFPRFVRDLPDDTLLVVVDYHV